MKDFAAARVPRHLSYHWPVGPACFETASYFISLAEMLGIIFDTMVRGSARLGPCIR